MQRDWKRSVRTGVVSVAFALTAAQGAYAVGTASGTSVDNRATVSYAIGSTAQPVIESSPTGNSTTGVGNGVDTSFVVDNRIDLTVVELSGGYTQVAAGGVNEVLVFTVANTGNTTQDFSLSSADNGTDPFGGTDNFDAAVVGIFVDANNDSLYDAGDTATFIDELAADTDVEVFVVRNIPGGQANGDISAVTLTAQVAQGGGVGVQGADILTDDSAIADDPATVQVVFGDGAGDTDAANDGAHSDTDAYIVGAAQINVSKTSAVLSDPINGGANPKAIPGATVEYTVTVSNAVGASATATNVQVSDSLNAEITAGTVAFDANGYAAGAGMQVTAPNIAGGAPTALSNAADADQGDFTANAVTVNGITLNAGESATVRFRVVIQ
ncbi:MAG TPA: hypothetical protein VFT98_21445 [Myxococcota bacterium]|nr:hypothetical protein [Myxococcota bacterium]